MHRVDVGYRVFLWINMRRYYFSDEQTIFISLLSQYISFITIIPSRWYKAASMYFNTRVKSSSQLQESKVNLKDGIQYAPVESLVLVPLWLQVHSFEWLLLCSHFPIPRRLEEFVLLSWDRQKLLKRLLESPLSRPVQRWECNWSVLWSLTGCFYPRSWWSIAFALKQYCHGNLLYWLLFVLQFCCRSLFVSRASNCCLVIFWGWQSLVHWPSNSSSKHLTLACVPYDLSKCLLSEDQPTTDPRYSVLPSWFTLESLLCLLSSSLRSSMDIFVTQSHGAISPCA